MNAEQRLIEMYEHTFKKPFKIEKPSKQSIYIAIGAFIVGVLFGGNRNISPSEAGSILRQERTKKDEIIRRYN